METNKRSNYIQEIKPSLVQARQKAFSTVNIAMVEAYWLIGKRIEEEVQNRKGRSEYGKEVIKKVFNELTKEFGKGFSATNLMYFHQFFNSFKKLIRQAVSDQFEQINFTRLNWTHIRQILRVTSIEAQLWYLQEAAQQNWSVRKSTANCEW